MTTVSLSDHELRLIQLLREAKAAQALNDSDDWHGPHTALLELALAQVLDGQSVGYARHLLHGAADMLACTARFSVGSAWFEQEVQAREALVAEQVARLLEASR